MHKLDRVGNRHCLSLRVDNLEAVIAFKGRSNIKSGAAAVISRFSRQRFVVDDDAASHGTHMCGSEAECAIAVFPGVHWRMER